MGLDQILKPAEINYFSGFYISNLSLMPDLNRRPAHYE